MRGNAPERLVSGSDDFTMFLWEPTISKQPKARMTGHQKVYDILQSFVFPPPVILCKLYGFAFEQGKVTHLVEAMALLTTVCAVCFAVWMQVVNHVYFSPDGQWLASASFDKSVKLWNGITGKFVTAFRGHVADVYQIRSAAAAFSLETYIHTYIHTFPVSHGDLMPN